MKHMITTNQQSTSDIQAIKRKESKHNTTESSTCKRTEKEETERTTKIIRKQLIKWQQDIAINNHFKCKWIKRFQSKDK